MSRSASRDNELVALIMIPLLAIVAVVVAFATGAADSWAAIGAGIVGACFGTPLYLAWLVWFLVRSNRR